MDSNIWDHHNKTRPLQNLAQEHQCSKYTFRCQYNIVYVQIIVLVSIYYYIISHARKSMEKN